MDIIREDFFHFLWKNLHFHLHELQTTAGDKVHIIHPGYANEGDGPDYRYAKIRLNDILFYGDVELHKKASEWRKHGHHKDNRYEGVILHVVLHDDLHRKEVTASDGQSIPTLELRSSLPESLARLWRAYNRPAALPCSGLIPEMPDRIFRKIARTWDNRYFDYRINRMISLYPADKPISEAWQNMLVLGIFQGLGYHKNQENMLRLADALYRYGYLPQKNEIFTIKESDSAPGSPANRPVPDPVKVQQLSNTLLIMSGLQPHHNEYRHNSNGPPTPFKGILPEHTGVTPRITGVTPRITENNPEIKVLFKHNDWDFSASRPANHPDTRIRQGAELLLQLQRLKIKDWLKYPSDTLWRTICRLHHAPSLGKNRREVIFYNVVIPSVYLIGSWLQYKKKMREACCLWSAQDIPLPKRTWTTLKKSAIPPGDHYSKLATLHHFKYFCSEKRCAECGIMRYFAQA